MKCAVDELPLSFGDLLITLRRPVFQRIGIFAHHPLAGAGGIQQDGVKAFRQRGAKHPTIEVGQGDVADAAAADIGMQDFNPTGGKLVGENPALISHARSNLCSFGTRGGGHIHDPLRHVAIGKQRRNRQHRTGFLDVKQAAEMFGGAAQRQGVLIIAFDPKALFAPRDWRQLPAIGRDLLQKVGDGNFQRIHAQAAA